MRERLTICNHRDQPVELHLRSSVLVISPGGTAEVDAEDAAVPQVAVLARQRMISLWPARSGAAEAQPAGAQPAEQVEAPAKKAAVHKGKGKQTHSEGDE